MNECLLAQSKSCGVFLFLLLLLPYLKGFLKRTRPKNFYKNSRESVSGTVYFSLSGTVYFFTASFTSEPFMRCSVSSKFT